MIELMVYCSSFGSGIFHAQFHLHIDVDVNGERLQNLGQRSVPVLFEQDAHITTRIIPV